MATRSWEIRSGAAGQSNPGSAAMTAPLPAQRPLRPPARALPRPALDPAAIWHVVGPFLGRWPRWAWWPLSRRLLRSSSCIAAPRPTASLATIKSDAPDSEMPPESPAARQAGQEGAREVPARAVKLSVGGTPPHPLQSSNVRRSKMHPHKFAGINFTEYPLQELRPALRDRQLHLDPRHRRRHRRGADPGHRVLHLRVLDRLTRRSRSIKWPGVGHFLFAAPAGGWISP